MNVYDKDWLPAMLIGQVVLGFVLSIIALLFFGPFYNYLNHLNFHGVNYNWIAFPILLIPYIFHLGKAIENIKFNLRSKSGYTESQRGEDNEN